MTYSFGILYVEFLEEFKEGKGYTSWILSILVGMTLCSGNEFAFYIWLENKLDTKAYNNLCYFFEFHL